VGSEDLLSQRSCDSEGGVVTSSRGHDCEALHRDGFLSAVLPIEHFGFPGLAKSEVTINRCRIFSMLPRSPIRQAPADLECRDLLQVSRVGNDAAAEFSPGKKDFQES
jgi:hypothetical protein